MVVKQVQFFDPVVIHPDNSQGPLTAGFWPDLMNESRALADKQRSFRYNSAYYYGEAGIGVTRALPFLRIGRIRERADWPDTVDDTFRIAPLDLQRRKLFEAAYLVPFGTGNHVAFMGPLRGIVRARAIENWLTGALDLVPQGRSIELAPIVDPGLARKLRDAEGVSRLKVRVPYDADLSFGSGRKGQVESAIEAAVDSGEDALDVEVTFSFGRRGAHGPMAERLLSTARRFAGQSGPDKIEASLILQDGDGYKTEHHDLIRDKITAQAVFSVQDDAHVDLEAVLEGIALAIDGFRAQA